MIVTIVNAPSRTAPRAITTKSISLFIRSIMFDVSVEMGYEILDNTEKKLYYSNVFQ